MSCGAQIGWRGRLRHRRFTTGRDPGQAVWVCICPGLEIVITPPQAHWHMLVAVSAGAPLICTVGEPGDHGEVVTGMQGCGVSTPSAAEVAAATCGFDNVMHIPKGMMLTFGAKP